MHLLLAVIGALIGALLASNDGQVFATAVGLFAGLAVAQAIVLSRRLKSLQEEVDRLRASVAPERDRDQSVDLEEAPVKPAAPAADANPISPGTSRSAGVYTTAQPASSPQSTPVPRLPAARRAADGRKHEPDFPFQAAIRGFFTGGNALVRAGVVVLFFGVAFLLRYLAEHTHVPIEFRLTGVAFGGLILLVLGWRLRIRRPGYALAVQGGAVGILYMTVYAALRLYKLLSPAMAFPFMVLIAALSAALAVLQGSLAFALLAITGGFLAPILASSGNGDHVVLFSYYVVLNAAILVIAWFKAWRPLNLVGFVFTFVIATLWGVLHYRPEDFATTEPFLILFFLSYVAIAVLFTLRQPLELRGYVDGTLVFGTPLASFGLQTAMLHEQLLPLAYSALTISGIYLSIAWVMYRRQGSTQRLLVEAFLALGVTFMTLAVPLALNGRWSTATWAVEGAALIWIGCRQNRPLARGFGALLQIAAGCTIMWHLNASEDHFIWPAGMYLSGFVVAAASVFSAHILNTKRERMPEYERLILVVLFLWGLIWWCLSGVGELQRRLAPAYVPAAELSYLTLTALLSSELYRRFHLAVGRITALFLLPLMILFAAALPLTSSHPLGNGGWICWPLAFTVFYVVARRHEGTAGGALATVLHSLSAWLLAALLSCELQWQVGQVLGVAGSWSGISWAVVPALFLYITPRLTATSAWPFNAHRRIYLINVACGYALYLSVWSATANVLMRGDSYPLPYIPLFNPLDLTQAFVLMVLIRHYIIVSRGMLSELHQMRGLLVSALTLLAFLALNGALVRTLNHWAGVPFSLDGLRQSTLAQTSFSIFWALLALITMLVATGRANRNVWIAGSGLLAIVVIKLFLVDLARIGSIERIVSFVSVGLLMLVLGYFSPLPPGRRESP